jgi:HlyD family secretion protein
MTRDTQDKQNGSALSTPEELSRRITIVDMKGRFAVWAGGVLALALLGWSVFGSVPEMVEGTGMLVPPEGLMDVVSLGQGQVTEMAVGPGDMVGSGDIVARISMPELEAERQSLLAGLKNTQLWSEERSSYYEQTLRVQGRNNADNIEHLRFRMTYLTEYFQFLKKHVSELEAADEGIITPKEVESTRKNMQSVLAEINDCKQRIAEIQAQELDLASRSEQDELQTRERESELRLSLESVDNRLRIFSRVRSPYDGVVVELGVEQGDYVSPGTPMVTLRPVDSPLEASLLFPVDSGKKVRPGMLVYVYPSTAAREEYGCIYGLVSSVTEYPVSAQSLMQSIGTKEFISKLMEQGPMIMARISLLRDPDTPTGFKWSSSGGPENVSIEAGTICAGSVVLERSRPIDLVFPKFSKMLGLAKP